MKGVTVVGVLGFLLAACAGGPENESVILKNDAIDDYIEVAELKDLDQIRINRELHHKSMTEDYILVYDGKDPYLLAFQRRCRELNEREVTPDYRYDARILHARYDTYRGCKIRSLYEVTKGQAEELLALGTISPE